MNGVSRQNVVLVLGELQERPEYLAPIADSAGEAQANEFRRGVQTIERLCLQNQPREATDDEIRDRLIASRNLCVGPLARFGRFIERARTALG